jgi:hypothetical protein
MGTKKIQDHDLAAKRAEVSERIEEAWDVLKRMPDKEMAQLRQAESGQVWPLIVYTADEHAAWAKVPVKRPPPNAAQVSRMEEVLDWLSALAKQDRKYCRVVWLFCALHKKPNEVSRILGCHRETATVWRDNGLDRIVRHRDVKPMKSLKLRDSLMQGMHHPKRAAG